MKLILEFSPYVLDFRFDAGTSRGVMRKRKIWLVRLHEEGNSSICGIGECAPLEGLSAEDISQIDFELDRLKSILAEETLSSFSDDPLGKVASLTDPVFSSVRFAVETAVLDLLNGGQKILYQNKFSKGTEKIPINGLIWMGDKDFMHRQIDEKIKAGFSCVKMKVGAIDFSDELALLKMIRDRGGEGLDLRIDANGAFPNREAFRMLTELEDLGLHSIEQPIMPRQPEAMSLICEKSLIPIALDEDLIGIYTTEKKEELLTYVKPHYIVIKPSLAGGLASSAEWIRLAEKHGIGWWITSALESNIGLNAIAQFTANYALSIPQGLGTGQLYHNNFASPLHIEDGFLSYQAEKMWSVDQVTF